MTTHHINPRPDDDRPRRRIDPLRPDRLRCTCGATAEGDGRCRKCCARGLWERRNTGRRSHPDRPPTRPRERSAAAPCALGSFGAVPPAFDHTLVVLACTVIGLALLVFAVRLLRRWLRERAEDRADAITAAKWQAEHAPHLLTESDGRDTDPRTDHPVFGVRP